MRLSAAATSGPTMKPSQGERPDSHHDEGRPVCADAVKDRVVELVESAVAEGQVEARCGQAVNEYYGGHVDIEAGQYCRHKE